MLKSIILPKKNPMIETDYYKHILKWKIFKYSLSQLVKSLISKFINGSFVQNIKN